MDREQMKLAILKQEQTFRQQVHELHRLYHVQKHLMEQTQPATSSCVPPVIDVKPKQEFQIVHHEKPINHKQLFSFSCSQAPAPVPAPAPTEDYSLELTLATGTSSSSSSGNAGRQPAKRLKSPSNSDSGTTTAVSSTSTESGLALFGEVDVTKTAVRFQSREARRMGEMAQGAWIYQCLSLKTA